mmetsp:Transcript_24012/g.39318  ORF Transcript_24012/g.39318 Transcript_24012/m.39318 type:complete len:170 (+) Transcript_24012:143-652(+)
MNDNFDILLWHIENETVNCCILSNNWLSKRYSRLSRNSASNAKILFGREHLFFEIVFLPVNVESHCEAMPLVGDMARMDGVANLRRRTRLLHFLLLYVWLTIGASLDEWNGTNAMEKGNDWISVMALTQRLCTSIIIVILSSSLTHTISSLSISPLVIQRETPLPDIVD